MLCNVKGFHKTVYFLLNNLTHWKKNLLNLYLKLFVFITLIKKKVAKETYAKKYYVFFFFLTIFVCCDQLMLVISVFMFDQNNKSNANLIKL